MKNAIALVFVLLLVGGCDNRHWQTKDVTGLLPELQFTLARADGESLTANQLRGQHVLVFFGFTSCPDVCPTTLMRLASLNSELSEPMQERMQVVFVSVDPARDTPKRLRAYVKHFDGRFIAVTGTKEQLREMARRYRTTFSYGKPDENGHYEVSHSSGVYVFDDKGRARLLFRPADSIGAMRNDLKQLMQ